MDERRLQRLQTGFAANDLLITDEWASFPSARPALMPDAEVQALARGRTAVIYHHDPRQKGGHDAEVDHWIEGIAGYAGGLRQGVELLGLLRDQPSRVGWAERAGSGRSPRVRSDFIVRMKRTFGWSRRRRAGPPHGPIGGCRGSATEAAALRPSPGRGGRPCQAPVAAHAMAKGSSTRPERGARSWASSPGAGAAAVEARASMKASAASREGARSAGS